MGLMVTECSAAGIAFGVDERWSGWRPSRRRLRRGETGLVTINPKPALLHCDMTSRLALN